jgi:hypothetical protein
LVAAVAKWRRRDMPMSVAEKAEYLSKRRARMLPALAVIFLSQQVTFFSTVNSPGSHSAYNAKIWAWLVLSIVLLLALSTKGFWLERKEVRDLIDDETPAPIAMMRCAGASCSRWRPRLRSMR